MNPYLWDHYTPNFIQSILTPRHLGFLHENEGEEDPYQGISVVTGSSGDVNEGNKVLFFWVINTTNGQVIDAKFQAYGETPLIGISDIVCEQILNKRYDRARNLNKDLIKYIFCDTQPSLAKDIAFHLKLISEAIEIIIKKCEAILLAPSHSTTSDEFEEGEGLPGWDLLPSDEKLKLIQDLIRQEIQPYVELDGGGVEVLTFNNDRDVIIAYHGACTTCPASTGATLDAIQSLLRSRLSSTLNVIPDPSCLQDKPM